MPDLEPASALARRICAGPGAYESDDQDRADWEAEIRERDAAVREEALREAIRFIRSESSASESIGKHEWARFGSWLANKLTEELPPPAAQKEPPHAR